MKEESTGRFQLSVVTGLHAGTSIDIGDQPMTVGNSMAADIVLMDKGVNAHHLTLEPRFNGLMVRAQADNVLLNGQSMDAGASVMLRGCQDRLQIAEVTLTIVADRAAANDRAFNALDNNSLIARFQRYQINSSWLNPHVQELANAQLRKAGKLCSRYNLSAVTADNAVASGKVIIGGSVLAMVLSWSTVLFTSSPVSANPDDLANRDLRTIDAWLQDNALDHHIRSRIGSDGISLSGSVPDAQARAALDQKLTKLKTPVRKSLSLDSDVTSRAESILSQFTVSRMSVSGGANGRFTASGYAGTQANWQRARNALLSDLPNVRELDESAVVTLEDLAGRLSQRLEQAGLDSGVILTVTAPSTIRARGLLPDSELRLWNQVKRLFESNSPGDVFLMSEVYSTRELLGLDIRTVSHGDNPYVMSADGRRLMRGSALQDGYVVKDIQHDVLLVTKDGHDFPLEFNR